MLTGTTTEIVGKAWEDELGDKRGTYNFTRNNYTAAVSPAEVTPPMIFSPAIITHSIITVEKLHPVLRPPFLIFCPK